MKKHSRNTKLEFIKQIDFKFKVWDNELKQWSKVRNLLLNRVGSSTYYELSNDLGRFTILPFTGYSDVKGQEIYKGDILKCLNRTTNIQVIASFRNGCFLFEDRLPEEFFQYNKVEVIGNICET